MRRRLALKLFPNENGAGNIKRLKARQDKEQKGETLK